MPAHTAQPFRSLLYTVYTALAHEHVYQYFTWYLLHVCQPAVT